MLADRQLCSDPNARLTHLGPSATARGAGVEPPFGNGRYGECMKSSLGTWITVIVAVVVAWFLVNALFSLAWLIAKIVIVAIVAVVVYGVIRTVSARRDS